MGDKEGFRLRTIKLRGQVSQGLAVPTTCLAPENIELGADVTELLGVEKYEPPIPAQLAGLVKGNFPDFIPKTDQERCQNMINEIFVDHKDAEFEVTIKLDGTPFTGYHSSEDTGVCSRNWELKIEDGNKDNTIVRMFIDSGLQTALSSINGHYAIQGESMGPGIQKNKENFNKHVLAVFDIYDIDAGAYLSAPARYKVMDKLIDYGLNQTLVMSVPVVHKATTLADMGINNIDDLIAAADGPSINASKREGLVFKEVNGKFSFKVISNRWLLKYE